MIAPNSYPVHRSSWPSLRYWLNPWSWILFILTHRSASRSSVNMLVSSRSTTTCLVVRKVCSKKALVMCTQDLTASGVCLQQDRVERWHETRGVTLSALVFKASCWVAVLWTARKVKVSSACSMPFTASRLMFFSSLTAFYGLVRI